MWSLTRFVRHSGLPQKAAVPPLSPVWPIARILAWGQACVSSRSPDLNKKKPHTAKSVQSAKCRHPSP